MNVWIRRALQTGPLAAGSIVLAPTAPAQVGSATLTAPTALSPSGKLRLVSAGRPGVGVGAGPDADEQTVAVDGAGWQTARADGAGWQAARADGAGWQAARADGAGWQAAEADGAGWQAYAA